MGRGIVRRIRVRRAEAVLAAAWQVEIDSMRTRKSSPDPGSIPCHHCDAESSWHVSRCQTCGADYDGHAQRFRARMYQAFILGD